MRLAVLICSLAAGSVGFAPSAAKTHTVVIDAVKFEPADLTVKAGDTVVWTNKDPFPHTATSERGGFDSRQILTGKTWKFRAAKKGEYPYICTLHPTMTAILRVE